jgi:hypothetical protein
MKILQFHKTISGCVLDRRRFLKKFNMEMTLPFSCACMLVALLHHACFHRKIISFSLKSAALSLGIKTGFINP